MADKTAPAAAPPQEGDWPPGYVPGQGFVNQPSDDLNGDATDPNAPPAVNGAASEGAAPPPAADISSQPSVPLSQLKAPKPQNIDCPNCHEKHQTKVVGRSEGKQKLHGFLWWPLPDRRHYFEKTHWYCSNCDHHLATQKRGKPLQVMAKQG